MEVLRPSTPMPYGKKLSKLNYIKSREKYANTSMLPHLKPLFEERLAKRAKAADLVQPFQRCGFSSCEEGETVEVFQLSPGKNMLKLNETKEKIPERFARLPGIANDKEHEVLGTFAPELKCFENENLNQNKAWNAKQELTQTNRSTSSKSSSSLPSLEFSNCKVTPTIYSRKCKKNLSLQKHIELEDRNFDPSLSKEAILQKYFEGQR